ncbi:nucleoside triphosphate pyrophosphohydrolase [Flavobacterium sp. xlx-214]|uniref:nucleoside triphosphate pyrophosphohydrolase n=1 Tax=unclassified Flavobacterium TaxID=196869 RepID=UPI0013D6DB25|nr:MULTISPECIES: nucleoside triphosphate pyrophosphohydrolase [unclassified Flavobacterium]MBA5793727.1 nucleoside triphosphate pyrophosphohydrolase [Flavobacterium sp. xlx-221]QMI83252.1 nucleoside triphosphate pyrophosphohydrolase [Flavobacterium sp. xlx-214]
MNNRANQLKAFERLLDIMDDLREKCPWDQKQTFQSLKHLTIEEVYELNDAISENNPTEIKKEIGDLLLHLVFYAKIGSETQLFDIEDVCNTLCEKLIYRHPHIYGNVEANDEKTVKENWEKLKLKEGNKSVLSGVPKSLPAIVKAYRIQDKVKGVGFDWDNKEDVWKKVEEELDEFKFEVSSNNFEKQEQEFGDVLFALINYARFCDIDPEEALNKTNNKFINRFTKMEDLIKKDSKQLGNLSLNELDVYWDIVKKLEKK